MRAGIQVALLLPGLLFLASLHVAADSSEEAAREPKLKLGDKAPSFEAKDDEGKTWKSTDHVGKKILIVYFYPADMTGGCTKEACGFRDSMKPLASEHVEVIGVSGDSPKNHQVFKEFHNLNFTLLADEDGTVAKKFGVPTRPGGTVHVKDRDGKEVELKRGVTAERWTFIIDRDGKIAYRNTKVGDTANHARLLMATIKVITGK